jgi:hypothetical protein
LLTRSFQTTTILYYTFFIPGVFLHELSYWLVAGILNVHAKSAIQWPEAQEIAELDLSFIELAKNVNPFKLAIITLAPIISGLLAIWLIANNVLDFSSFFALIRTGDLADISAAFSRLTGAADFWLWIYLLFTISNTMIPKLRDLRGLRIVFIAVGVLVAIFIVIGVGEQVVVRALVGPVADALNLFSGTLVIIILIDMFFVLALGTVEAVIERITGHSATFRRGKLIAITRQERLEMRQRQARRETRSLRSGASTQARPALSIYSRPLEIPGPPGDEPVTQSETFIIEKEDKPSLPPHDDRQGPDIVTTGAEPEPRRNLATPALAQLPANTEDEDVEDNEQDEDEPVDEPETDKEPSLDGDDNTT